MVGGMIFWVDRTPKINFVDSLSTLATI